MSRPRSFTALFKALRAGIKLMASAGGGATASPVEVDEAGGDYESGIIKNVVLAKPGTAKGWGWSVEASEMQNLLRIVKAAKDGLKCRADHPLLFASSVGTTIAAVKNFRIDSAGRLIGDIHFLEAANPEMRRHIISLAKQRPDFIAMSLYGQAAEVYFYNKDGKKQSIRSEEDYDAWAAMPEDTPAFIRFGSISAFDVVDEGALTDGLAASIPTTFQASTMSKRLKFDINADTADGVAIKIKTNATEPTVGDEVVAIDENGAETGPAPDGTHELAGDWAGYTITIADGKISEVTAPEAEAESETEASAGEQAQAAAGDHADNVQANAGTDAAPAWAKALIDSNAQLQATVQAQAKQMDEFKKLLAKTPAGVKAAAAGTDVNAGAGGVDNPFDVAARQFQASLNKQKS